MPLRSSSIDRFPALRRLRQHCRLFSLLCLGAWQFSVEGAIPASIALLGHLDPVHEVAVLGEADGGVVIRFTHANEEECQMPHGILLQTLLFIGGASTSPEKDHEFSFHSVDEGLRGVERAMATPAPPSVNLGHYAIFQRHRIPWAGKFESIRQGRRIAAPPSGRVIRC